MTEITEIAEKTYKKLLLTNREYEIIYENLAELRRLGNCLYVYDTVDNIRRILCSGQVRAKE